MSAPAPGPTGRRRALALALLAGLLAAALVALGTARRGPARYPDGVAYLGAAESLARGGGLRYPVAAWDAPDSTTALAHWPPGMSLAAAAPIALGVGPVESARILLVLAAFATAAIAVWLLLRVAGAEAAAIGLALLVTARPVTHVHLATQSEPLFLTCLAAQLALMVRRPRAPLAYGAAAAAATLVRYVGAALGAVAVAWALAQPGSARERLRRAALAALPSVLLVGAWFVHLRRLGQGTRELAPPARPDVWWGPFQQGAETIGYWLAPFASDLWPGSVLLAGLGMLLLVTLALRRAWLGLRPEGAAAEPTRSLLRAASLAGVALLAMVLVARFAADPYIPLDDRMLSPVFLAAALASATLLARVRRAGPPPTRRVATAVLAVWLGFAGARTLDYAARVQGRGPPPFEPWTGGQLLPWLAGAGRDYELYTNNPFVVYFRAGRASRELPLAWDPATDSAFVRRLAAGPGALVGFRYPQTVVPRPLVWGRDVSQLAARLGLCRVAVGGTEGVWVAPGDDACPAPRVVSAPPTPPAARDSSRPATP